jgi:hypothetical protein
MTFDVVKCAEACCKDRLAERLEGCMDCRQQVEAGNTLRKWVQQRGGDTQVAALEQNLHA